MTLHDTGHDTRKRMGWAVAACVFVVLVAAGCNTPGDFMWNPIVLEQPEQKILQKDGPRGARIIKLKSGRILMAVRWYNEWGGLRHTMRPEEREEEGRNMMKAICARSGKVPWIEKEVVLNRTPENYYEFRCNTPPGGKAGEEAPASSGTSKTDR